MTLESALMEAQQGFQELFFGILFYGAYFFLKRVIGHIFALALYWSDLGQVFCSKCFFDLRIDSSVFLFLNSIALVISSPFLFEVCRKLVTFGRLCFELAFVLLL